MSWSVPIVRRSLKKAYQCRTVPGKALLMCRIYLVPAMIAGLLEDTRPGIQDWMEGPENNPFPVRTKSIPG